MTDSWWIVESDLTVADHRGTGSLQITNDGWVSVYGTLRLNPSGTITLDGGNLSVGNLDLAGGTLNWISGYLSCSGELTQEAMTINANSRLQLSHFTGDVHVKRMGALERGYVTGNVVNHGDVSLSLSSGISIDGNYTQGPGSTLTTHMNGQEVLTFTPGKLSVTGTATISGGMVRPLPTPGIYSSRYQYPILHADQGIVGVFEGVIQPAIVQFSLAYDADNVYLIAGGANSFQSQGATNNQQAIGHVLDTLDASGISWGWGSHGLWPIWDSLSVMPLAEFQQALEELNPAIFDAFTSVSFDSTAAYLSATSRGFHHLNVSPSAAPSTAPMAFDDISPQTSSGQPLHLSINPPAAPAADRNLSLWASTTATRPAAMTSSPAVSPSAATTASAPRHRWA